MAVTLVFLTFLLPGDHVLVPDSAYGPVRNVCRDYLAPRGIGYTIYDPVTGAGIAELITDRTKLVWVESPGSGTMEVQDIPAIDGAAKARGVLVGCDNTWCTPLPFKPLDHGCDFAAGDHDGIENFELAMVHRFPLARSPPHRLLALAEAATC